MRLSHRGRAEVDHKTNAMVTNLCLDLFICTCCVISQISVADGEHGELYVDSLVEIPLEDMSTNDINAWLMTSNSTTRYTDFFQVTFCTLWKIGEIEKLTEFFSRVFDSSLNLKDTESCGCWWDFGLCQFTFLIAGSLESAYWWLSGGHNIMGHGGGEPLVVLW